MALQTLKKKSRLNATKYGAKEAYVVEEPFAAAVGAGLLSQIQLGMIVDIGGVRQMWRRFRESMNSRSIRVGGDEVKRGLLFSFLCS